MFEGDPANAAAGSYHAIVEVLSLDQKISLLSGQDTWTTPPILDAGIRSVRMSDGPNGIRAQVDGGDALGFRPSLPATCFPPAVAIGSSWDVSLAARIGEALGLEGRSLGVDIVLAPGVNIKRSPLCGRNFEYFSEDPLLSGALGTGYVRGIQSTGAGASVKHFAANNQEADRMRVSVQVDERTLREIYFPAFERVVKDAQPATVMCAYNRINGTYGSENAWLLNDVLRGEWGFGGVVVSDWGAVHRPAVAVAAGLDLQMPGTRGRSAGELKSAVKAGELDPAIIDRAVERVLGLTAVGGDGAVEVDLDDHHALAREGAEASIVLLKNDGTLPLAKGERCVVVGEFARTPRFQGGGSSHVNATRTVSFLDALDVLGVSATFVPGFTLDGSGDAESLRRAAVESVSSDAVALVFAGLSEADESEGYDREGIELPSDQIDLIREVAAIARRTVVVLSHGGVVGLEGWHDDVESIVDGFLLGQAGGAALANVVFGIANPSGRLAESIPVRIQDTAAFGNFPGEQGSVVYGERILVGYRWHATRDIVARYPFGHGLSYTTFRTSEFTVAATGEDTARVNVTVTNTGAREGAYVAQVYVDSTRLGFVQRSARELRAFRKVLIPAGESRDLEFELDRRAFAYWDVELGDWVVTPGSYRVILGHDALAVDKEAPVRLVGDTIVRELTLSSTTSEWFEHPIVGPVLLDTLDSDLLRAIAEPAALRMLGSLPMQKVVNLLGDSIPEAAFESLMASTRNAGLVSHPQPSSPKLC